MSSTSSRKPDDEDGVYLGEGPECVCALCSRTEAWVFVGLAVFGIEYSGPVRSLCNFCIDKIKKGL